MNTSLCKILGIDFPLFAFSHCRDVVAAVSKAGGFGVLGTATFTPEQLKIELDWIDAHVDGKPYGVDLAVAENMETKAETNQTSTTLRARIPEQHKRFADELLAGHGVDTTAQVPSDEEHEIGQFLDTAERVMDECFRHPIRLIVNALGRPPQSMMDRARARGIPVGALVGSKEHAIRQLEYGVDLLVAQGTEAAAHCGEVTTMVLVPEIVEAVEQVRPVPVLAAGGIVTGRQMAAVMTMGAAGAWTGSVWLPTMESDVPEMIKEKLLAARSRDTIRSRAFTGKTCRQLRSSWNAAWEAPESPGALPMPFQHLMAERAMQLALKSAAGGNDRARDLLTEGVGQAVGMLNSTKSARGVVQDFREDFAAALERINALVE